MKEKNDLANTSLEAMNDGLGLGPIDTAMYQDGVSHADRLTSHFKSTDLGAKGEIFGIKLDPGMAKVVQFMMLQALPELVEYSSNNATKVAQSFAHNFVTKDPKAALEFAKNWGKVIPRAALLAVPITELGVTAYKTSNKLYELRQALSIISKANGQAALGAGIFSDSGNEVIHNARQKIFSAAKNDVLSTTARNAFALAPSYIRLNNLEKEKLEKGIGEAELEHIKKYGSAEDVAKYRRDRLKFVAETSRAENKIINEQLKIEKELYEKDFKTFSTKRYGDANYAYDKAVEDHKLQDVATELGVSTGGLNKEKLQEKFEEQWLKNKFAEENGAWDQSWLPPEQKKQYSEGKGKIETHEDVIRAEHKKEIDRMNGVVTDPSEAKLHDTTKTTVNQLVQAMATMAGQTLSSVITSKDNKKLSDTLALDMILHMRRDLDENAERDTISGANEENKSEEYSYAHYVHRVFQQQQHDSGLAEIGDKYVQHLRGSRWDDEDIQKMKDSELDPYEVAIKHISQYIKDGRMDALALINLVGERKIVAKSGKSFGMRKSGSDEDICKNLLAEIDKQAALLKPHHKMNGDEVSEALGHYSFTKEELQAAFKDGTLGSDAKAFLFTLVDMNTPDDEVVKDLTGLSDAQVKQMRATSQEKFTREFDAALREITEDIAQNPQAAVSKYNLTEDQSNHFAQLYQKAQNTDAMLDGALNADNRKQIAATVANVMIDDGKNHGGHLWSDRIKPRSEETKIRSDAELKQKSAEKMAISNQDYGASHADRFTDQVTAGANGYNRNDDMPFVSAKAQQHYGDPAMKSYTDRARSSQEIPMGYGA